MVTEYTQDFPPFPGQDPRLGQDNVTGQDNGSDARMRAMEEKIASLLEIFNQTGAPPVATHETAAHTGHKFETAGLPPEDVAGTMYESWWKAGFTRMEIELVGREKWRVRVEMERADTASVAREFDADVPLPGILAAMFDALARQARAEPSQRFDPNSQPANMMQVMAREEDRYFGRSR